jgi:very-short-patch-repair endonuclease
MFQLINIYFYKIIELRLYCEKFSISKKGTKTQIIDRILNYYLINTHNKKKLLCEDMRCKTCFNRSFLSIIKSKFWDYTKNNLIGKDNPRKVTKGNGHIKFWFICDKCNHSFDITLSNLNYNWCKYCVNKELCYENNCQICFNKSFASHEKAIHWDYTKNNLIDKDNPRKVTKGNGHIKFWFICDKCNHSFNITLSNLNYNWCKYCANQDLCENDDCKICFNKSFASHEKAIHWDYTKNNLIDKDNPRKVLNNTHTKFWFICDKCNHSFDIRLYSIQSGCWCRYCRSSNLCNNNDCQICFNKSFASHEKSIYWDYTKNNLIGKDNPRKVTKLNGRIKFWFICNKCNHSFDMIISSITSGNNWCRYCGSSELCYNDNCKICFNKSFASHEKAIYWDYTKNKDKDKNSPIQVCKGSKEKYWFICNKCNHSFDMSITSITTDNWCRYCGSSELCENNNCEICFNKSFASHEKCIYWDYTKNNLIGKDNPRKVTKGNGSIKFWFICNKCNCSFDILLKSITSVNCWCPLCINKTEKLLYNYFIDNNINFIKEYSLENGKYKNSNKPFQYDFYLNELNILVELDGQQHFKDIKSWKSECKTIQIKDCYKMKYIIKNIVGIKIIRLCQEDVYKNKIEYKTIINELLNANNLQQITYISKSENLYHKHKEYMNLNINKLYELSKNKSK